MRIKLRKKTVDAVPECRVLVSNYLANRLALRMQALNVKPFDLAEIFEVEAPVIANMIEGGVEISEEVALKLADFLGMEAEEILPLSRVRKLQLEQPARFEKRAQSQT